MKTELEIFAADRIKDITKMRLVFYVNGAYVHFPATLLINHLENILEQKLNKKPKS